MEFVVSVVVLLLLAFLLFFLGLGRLRHNRTRHALDDILIPAQDSPNIWPDNMKVSLTTFTPKKPKVQMTKQERAELNWRRSRAASLLEDVDDKTTAVLRGGPRAGETVILDGKQVYHVDIPIAPDLPDLVSALKNGEDYSIEVARGQYHRTEKVDSQLRRIYQWKVQKSSK